MEKKLTILNEEGMHARPAGVLAKTLSAFKSNVEIHFNGNVKNAKSIMAIMSLGLQKGSEVLFVAQGEDEAQAVETIENLVNNRFQLQGA
ncbi:MAG: HPr family phosphocarrier protein [Proteobacteria bacterium]|jgi:phosphocarrier protein|nr:HPr family phosphocarrier protein [Pseudomonadota bacterium]